MERNYIYELLQKHSRVIIPNFGAFLIKDKAKISVEGNQNITISFNDFLKFNDGILIDYIAQKQKIDKLQAGNIVNEYIQEIKSHLKSKGYFIIEGVGKLFTDDNDIVRFTQQIDESEITDDSKEKEKENDVKPAIDSALPKEKLAAKPEIKKEQKPVTEMKKEEKLYSNAEAPVKHKEVTINDTGGNSSKGKWIFSILLFIVLIIAGLYLAGFFNGNNHIADNSNDNTVVSTKNSQPATTDKTSAIINSEDSSLSSNPVVEKDSVIGDSAKSEDATVNNSQAYISKDEETNIQAETIEQPVPKPCHLIAASCDSKKAADKYVAKLRAQGYDSNIINEKNGHFRVSYGSYETKEIALKELEKLKAKKKSAWYLYYPID